MLCDIKDSEDLLLFNRGKLLQKKLNSSSGFEKIKEAFHRYSCPAKDGGPLRISGCDEMTIEIFSRIFQS
jgi:hypothetical protein